MTKKHFIALADHIRANDPVFRGRVGTDPLTDHGHGFRAGRIMEHETTIEFLADFCQSQNQRFQRDRWLAYVRGECGPNGGKL